MYIEIKEIEQQIEEFKKNAVIINDLTTNLNNVIVEFSRHEGQIKEFYNHFDKEILCVKYDTKDIMNEVSKLTGVDNATFNVAMESKTDLITIIEKNEFIINELIAHKNQVVTSLELINKKIEKNQAVMEIIYNENSSLVIELKNITQQNNDINLKLNKMTTTIYLGLGILLVILLLQLF